MAAERKCYTEEFKWGDGWLMEIGGNSIAPLAHDFGVNNNNLYQWRGVYGR